MAEDWKRQAGTLDPDERRHEMSLRDRSARAVRSIRLHHGEAFTNPLELMSATRSLLGDLMHLADREDWDLEDMLDYARTIYYEKEINGE